MGFLGCLYAGIIAVPALPPANVRAAQRLEVIAQNAGARLAITSDELLPSINKLILDLSYLSDIEVFTTSDFDPDCLWDPSDITPDSIAFIQYTSGSTSEPKGVIIRHNSLFFNQMAIKNKNRNDSNSTIVNWMPLHHDGGLIAQALQAILIGSHCVLMSPIDFLREPYRWLWAISHFRGRVSIAPNFAYDYCVSKISPQQRKTLDLSSWEVAINAAEPIKPETLENFTRVFAECGFRFEAFYPAYGLAEATVFVSGNYAEDQPRIKSFDVTALKQHQVVEKPPGSQGSVRLVGCGVTLDGQKIAIVDPERHIPLPAGAVGEIWVTGPGIAAGYWNNLEATRETFQAKLAEDDGHVYLRTGDLGFLLDGELFITGRIKDMIIIQGQNYYPQDIEKTVTACHPALRPGGCVAFAVDSPTGEKLVVVQSIREEWQVKLNPEDIIQKICMAVQQEHGIQVHAIALVEPESIHKTTSGKLRRFAVKADYENQSLKTFAVWRESKTSEPIALPSRNALEHLIQKLMMVSLQLDHIEPNADFFDLGGDSLKFADFTARLEDALGILFTSELPLLNASAQGIAAYILEKYGTPSQTAPQIAEKARTPNRLAIFYHLLTNRAIGTIEKLYRIQDYLRYIGAWLLVKLPVSYQAVSKTIHEISKSKWMQRIVFRKPMRILEKISRDLPEHSHPSELLQESIQANFLRSLRLAKLCRLPDDIFYQHVHLEGMPNFHQAYQKGKGVILLTGHTSMSFLIHHILLMQEDITQMMVIGGKPYRTRIMGHKTYQPRFMLSEESLAVSTDRLVTSQYLASRETLEKGGVVFIAADGSRGKQRQTVPFFGRWRDFGLGFAKLAATTGTSCIPALSWIEPQGRICVQFFPELNPSKSYPEDKVAAYLEAYLGWYREIWQKHIGNFAWKHLQKVLRLPKISH